MPPPVPKYKITEIWENGKSQEVISVEKKRMGRPYTDATKKTVTKRARMTEQDVEKLKYCCNQLEKTESEIIRLGIDKVYEELKK